MKRSIPAIVLALMLIGPQAMARKGHDNALFVADVSDTVVESDLVAEGRRIVKEMNASFPDYVAFSGLEIFGNYDKPQIEWIEEMGRWEREALDLDAGDIRDGNGSTPIGAAVLESDKGLELAPGKTALIVISDGRNTGGRDPAESVETLKWKHRGDLCVFTILLGDDQDGDKVLKDMVHAGGCGKVSHASMLQTDEQIQELVDYIFPPRVCPDDDNDGVCNKDDLCANTPRGAEVDNRGCWVLDKVHFGYDKWDLKPEYHDELDNVVKVLEANPGISVEVAGHTDSDGSDEYNLDLSQKRAASVAGYLADHGVAESRLEAKGYGEKRPIESNDTDSGKARNRRVEIGVK